MDKANKHSIRITDQMIDETIRLSKLFGQKGARPLRQPSSGFPLGLIDQSGSMPGPPMTGAGKTMVIEAMAKAMGLDVKRVDASSLKDPGALDKLLGHPPGYEGFDSDDSLFDRTMADVRAVIRRREEAIESARNGDALAAQCRDGIASPASTMRPLRLRGASGAGFSIAGRMWS